MVFGMSDRDLLVIAVVGLAAASFLGVVDIPQLSVGGGGGGDQANFEPGKSATVDIRCFDATEDSRTQVDCGTVYTSNGAGTISDTSGSASSAYTFTYSTGERIDVWAHDSTYDYGELQQDILIDSEQKNIQETVWEGVTTSNIKLTVNEEDGTFNDGSVDAPGADGTTSFEGLDVKVDTANAAYNPVLIGAIYANSTNGQNNFSASGVQMPSAEKVDCPEHDADLDACWVAFNGAQEPGAEPLLQEFETASDQGNIVVEAGSSGVTANSGIHVWLQVMDYADFQNTEDGLSRGAEDDTSSPSDVGVGDVVTAISFE